MRGLDQTLRRHFGADLAAVVLRVMVTLAVVLLLRDLSGLQLGGLFPPGPEHLVQSGGVLAIAIPSGRAAYPNARWI